MKARTSVSMRFGKVFHLLSLLVFSSAWLLFGCSSGEKKPEYYSAAETAPLKLPADMDRPDHSSALVITVPYVPPPANSLESLPPRIASTSSEAEPNSMLRWSSEGLYLLVEDSPDSVHRRLGLVIERSGMTQVRLDERGVYRFDYKQKIVEEGGFFSKLAFWRRDRVKDYSGSYQALTRPDGENTRVYIRQADGAECAPDAAEHVLDVLRSRIG